MTKPIITFLETVGYMSPAVKRKLRSIIRIESFSRKHLFLRTNQTSSHVFFVLKGLLRGYRLKGKRGESTAWIMKEKDVVFDPRSFFTQTPSKIFIEALEPVTVGFISYDDLEQLYDDFPEFERIGRKLIERYYVLSEDRADDLRVHRAKDRYKVFLEKHPDLAKRVAVRHIASYLGITEESLSRIRGGKR